LVKGWYTARIMKILLAAGLYPPDIGGPATYAHMLTTELPRHGVTVTVRPYGAVRHLPKWRRHLTYAYHLWREAPLHDALYALDPMSVGVPARIVAVLRRKPLLVRLGGDYVWEQAVQRFGVTDTLDVYTANTTHRPFVVRALAWLQWWVVRGAVRVIVPSQYLKRVVSTWGIDAERISVIYSAHQIAVPALDRHELREDFNFSGLIIASIARLTPWKGMHTLIELIAMRKARGEITTLVIGGDGPERARLEALARERGIETQVRFVGTLTHDAVAAVVTAADVFILDTAYEGLSHQLIEVMALGTPIITTPVGGNPELITDGVDGLFVPVGDVHAYDAALTRLVTDDALRSTLTAKAKTRAEQFAARDAVAELALMLRSTIEPS